GRLRAEGLIFRLWSFANRRAFQAAHQVWVIGRDMMRLVERNYGVRLGRIQCVPHWSAVEIARPMPPGASQLLRRLALEGKFVVQYSGNMGLWHDLEGLVRAAALLRDSTD